MPKSYINVFHFISSRAGLRLPIPHPFGILRPADQSIKNPYEMKIRTKIEESYKLLEVKEKNENKPIYSHLWSYRRKDWMLFFEFLIFIWHCIAFLN